MTPSVAVPLISSLAACIFALRREKTRSRKVMLKKCARNNKQTTVQNDLWSSQVPSLNYLETMHNEELNMLGLDTMYS